MDNEKIVQDLYDQLIAEIKKYRPGSSLKLIEEAFAFAKEAHATQTRKTGEPYITHPLAVAIILAEIRSDFESLAAALLHDVVEDTDIPITEIQSRFGEEVALIVDGVTKILKVVYKARAEESEEEESPNDKPDSKETKKRQLKMQRQAENYRKLFFHMSQDVRVLLVKMADRLHNMRTLEGHSKAEKKREVAQETLDIYAPLAHRMGIAKWRYELEDHGFKYTNRDMYTLLKEKMHKKINERQAFVDKIMEQIRERMEKQGINAIIEGRAKRFYSIYKKMVRDNKQLEDLYDLYAVRIIVDSYEDCYLALGVVHSMYKPMPGRQKDYIGHKKQNGYQSYHTTLMGAGEPFEVQIRSVEMHAVAEYGIAAHWIYKETDKLAKDRWLQEMMDFQRELSGSEEEEFVDLLKMDLSPFQEHIYCFTPRGELIRLVKGSCPIDFAYAIHSAVGNRMLGALVNGKQVPINHELTTGDTVEIKTGTVAKGPSPDWFNYVKTSSARSRMTQWFNRENREDNIKKGREAMERATKEEYPSINLNILMQDREEFILNRMSCKTMDMLYSFIGMGSIKERTVVHLLYKEYEKTLPPPTEEELIQSLIEAGAKKTGKKSSSGIVVKGIGDTAVRFSRCCGPLPGDEIWGFVTRGRGITIHRKDCVNIRHMEEAERRRLIEAEWQAESTANNIYHSEMRIVCNDRDNLLADITRVLSDEKITVKTLNVRIVQGEAIIAMAIDIADQHQLDLLCNKIRNVPGVFEISRVAT